MPYVLNTLIFSKMTINFEIIDPSTQIVVSESFMHGIPDGKEENAKIKIRKLFPNHYIRFLL